MALKISTDSINGISEADLAQAFNSLMNNGYDTATVIFKPVEGEAGIGGNDAPCDYAITATKIIAEE